MKIIEFNACGTSKVLTLMAILLCTLVVACYPPMSDAPEDLTINLHGTVSDSISGSVVSGALLTYQGKTTSSDPAGEYHFGDLDKGSFTLSATHDGYQEFSAEVEVSTVYELYNVKMIPGSMH